MRRQDLNENLLVCTATLTSELRNEKTNIHQTRAAWPLRQRCPFAAHTKSRKFHKRNCQMTPERFELPAFLPGVRRASGPASKFKRAGVNTHLPQPGARRETHRLPRANSLLWDSNPRPASTSDERTNAKDTLAERLRRRPAKPMGSPRVGSNPTGVASSSQSSLADSRPQTPRANLPPQDVAASRRRVLG